MKLLSKIALAAGLIFALSASAQIPGVTIFSNLTTGNQPLSLLDSSFLATKLYIDGKTIPYPAAGIANSTGLAWGTPYVAGTAANNLVQLNGSAQLPAVSGANLTGTAASLTAGNATTAATVTTNANLTGPITSVGNATTIASPQGNGSKVQLSTGTTTANDCVKFDANGNTVDAGAACGSGGGSVTWPTSGDLVVSNGTSSPGGVIPCANGYVATVVSGVWGCAASTGSALLSTPTITGGTMTMGGYGTYGNTHTQFAWLPIAPSGTEDTWFQATSANANYGPQYDQVMGMGWNMSNTFGLVNPSHSSLNMRFENYWEPLTSGVGQHEFHIAIVPTDYLSNGEIRFLSMTAQANVTHDLVLPHATFSSNQISFQHPDYAALGTLSAQLTIGSGPNYFANWYIPGGGLETGGINLTVGTSLMNTIPGSYISQAPSSSTYAALDLRSSAGGSSFVMGKGGTAYNSGAGTNGDAFILNHATTGNTNIYNLGAIPLWFGVNNGLSAGLSAGGRFLIGQIATDDGVHMLQLYGSAIVSSSMSAATYLTNNKCANVASPAACALAPAGAVVVAVGATSVVVNTTAVTANSQILVTNDSSLGTLLGATCNTAFLAAPPQVTARTAGTSFTLSVSVAPLTNPQCFSYSIIN